MNMNLRFVKKIIALMIICASMLSCIKNDIPYPKRTGLITAFEVEGQTAPAVIDNTTFTITVELADTVDKSKVRLLRFEVSDSTAYEPDIESYIDMRHPLTYKLSTWPGQEYEWTIIANQTIERYIKAENQVGEAVFNVDECLAMLYVTMDTDLESIVITDIKLGPANSVISPDPRTVRDFTDKQKFTVTYRDIEEQWTIIVFRKDVSLSTEEADAWANQAYLYGISTSSTDQPGFKYRKKGETEWIDVPYSSVTVQGSSYSAHITGLEQQTAYEYMAVSGEDEGDILEFITEAAAQMPNMGFDEWVKSGKSWYPNADMENNHWWDSGNEGANLIGESNPTSPEDNFLAVDGVGKRAAKLETVSILGIMAGGNIYSGDFVKTEGTSGASVDFGRPFKSRPSQLKGYYCYEPKTIDKVKTPWEGLKGRPDRFHIFVYVVDSNSPFKVNTAKGIYLDMNDKSVIGYGEKIDSVSTGGAYKEFTVDIKYRDHRKAGYCVVVAVASQYADYFTGGIGSLMYVDEFEFVYDSPALIESF